MNKTFTPLFTIFFDKNSKLFSAILDMIVSIKNNEYAPRITKIYCNIFSNEYQDYFYQNGFEKNFINNQYRFSKLCMEGLDIYTTDIYSKLLDCILNLDYNYEILGLTKTEERVVRNFINYLLFS